MKPADRQRVWTAFRNLRGFVSSVYPYLSDIALGPCKMADDEHRTSDRQYAHVFHIDGQVCVASAIGGVERGNLYGVLLHEFGHLIIEHETRGTVPDEKQEKAADEVIGRAFGIRIRYYIGQPTVEWADPGTVDIKIMDLALK